jgi:zinc protease
MGSLGAGPADCPGVAHFVSKTIDRGTDSHTADQIAEDFENRGASLSVALNRHAMWLVCTCLSEDFEQILALVGNVAMRPTFPDSEVETRRGEIVTLLRQDQDNPASVAMERLMRSLYGETHPYGRPMRGALESVERIGRSDLQQFHHRRFAPQMMSLALVGDFDVTATVFGGWPATASEKVEVPPVVPVHARRVQVVPMMNKAQADIAYGFTSIRRLDPQYHAYSLMNNILGQYALGGRLGDSIRERQGMAYYTFSSLDASFAPGR